MKYNLKLKLNLVLLVELYFILYVYTVPLSINHTGNNLIILIYIMQHKVFNILDFSVASTGGGGGQPHAH